MKTISKKIKSIWINNFWPTSLLKDCSKGKPTERYLAYKYNQAQASLLQIPILNWIIFTIACAYGLVLSEWISKTIYPFAIYMAATFAIALTIGMLVAIILTVSYIFLKNIDIQLVKT